MIFVRSDIAQKFRQKMGLNGIQISWNGAAPDVLHFDARTLYKYGNNMGVNFMMEGVSGVSCSVSGSVKVIPDIYVRDDLENWAWSPVVDLDVGTTFFYNDTPEMYGTLRFEFAGTGQASVFLNRG